MCRVFFIHPIMPYAYGYFALRRWRRSRAELIIKWRFRYDASLSGFRMSSSRNSKRAMRIRVRGGILARRALPGRIHAVAKGITLTAMLAFLIGCRTGTSEADGKVHLRFSGYAGNPAETDLMKALVDDFNRGNPDVFVTYEPVPGQYYPKLLTMLVSNTAPDVFYLDIIAFRPFLAKQKILRPLNDLIAGSRALRRDDFLPELIDAFTDGQEVYGKIGRASCRERVEM